MKLSEQLEFKGWEIKQVEPLVAKKDWTTLTQSEEDVLQYEVVVKKWNYPVKGVFTYTEQFKFNTIMQVESILERISDVETQLYLMSKQKN